VELEGLVNMDSAKIEYKQIDSTLLSLYDKVPQRVYVSSYYKLEKVNRGLGGITFVETAIDPYIKDFRADSLSFLMARLHERFDTSNWAFFLAFDDDFPVGAAAVAARTEGVNMLEGRSDLAVLWDIRVDDNYKQQSIGQKLFDTAASWCKQQGMTQLKVECQNINIPACKFYHKQGMVLRSINENAYYDEPDCRHEVQLLWYLDL